VFANLTLPQRFALVAFTTALCGFALSVLASPLIDLSTFFLSHQDRWLLLAQALCLIVIGQRLPDRTRPLELSRGAVVAVAVLVAGFCYLGHFWVLRGYDLSRDEQMAVFDARIYSAGLRAQPLPALWQRDAWALNTLFMLPVGRPIAWVSNYLPMNALLRTAVGLVADPALTGPLLTGMGAVALYKCTRLLWPEDREASVLALLLYLTSGQILLAGMTAFSMPAHLTLNLIWLWLFLLRRWDADLAALLVGFVATGLHQPIFHPLFVAPFLTLLLRERAWTRLGFYGAGYALICGFWLAWPIWTHALVAGPNSVTAAGTDYWSRLKLLLVGNSDPRLYDTGANLLRFVAWQNMLLLPLMVTGAALAFRNRNVAALLASVLVPIGVVMVIMPFQGNGFGYRYLHGALGSAILLSVYGWRRRAVARAQLRSLVIRGALMATIVGIPLQLWMANQLYAAFASVDARIATSGTDYFAVGSDDTSFAGDLVLNRADLSNRPIRLFAQALRVPLITEICRRGPRIGLPTSRFYSPINAYFAAPAERPADERIERLTPLLRSAGCTVVVVGDPAVQIPNGADRSSAK